MAASQLEQHLVSIPSRHSRSNSSSQNLVCTCIVDYSIQVRCSCRYCLAVMSRNEQKLGLQISLIHVTRNHNVSLVRASPNPASYRIYSQSIASNHCVSSNLIICFSPDNPPHTHSFETIATSNPRSIPYTQSRVLRRSSTLSLFLVHTLSNVY